LHDEIDFELLTNLPNGAQTNVSLHHVRGRHMDYNANTGMRNPAWNEGKRACTSIMHPDDAEQYGFQDGQSVQIFTEAVEETIEHQVTRHTRPGYVMIPHGFGLVSNGERFGANANRLAKNTHRDNAFAPVYSMSG
jgi:anaerobic selenocysteine-containing dehydrogenase